jgi:hypothetical protein
MQQYSVKSEYKDKLLSDRKVFFRKHIVSIDLSMEKRKLAFRV